MQLAFGQLPCRRVPPVRHAAVHGHGAQCKRAVVACAADNVFDLTRFEDFPQGQRKAVVNAVDALGRRATSAEVASKAGLTIAEAERCLQSLVNDTKGGMKVSRDGDLVYELPGNFRARLFEASVRLRREAAFAKYGATLAKAGRISFGVALVVSIAIGVTAALAVATAASQDNDRNRGRGRPGGGVSLNFGSLWWDTYYWNRIMDPGYARRQPGGRAVRGDADAPKGPNAATVFEAAFSVVFGDGDPNTGFEEARWRAVGELVMEKGGVVAAEELAPLLDLEGDDLSDEAYMLPALLRLNGEVVVTEDGDMLYRFPELQRRAAGLQRPGAAQRAGGEPPRGAMQDWISSLGFDRSARQTGAASVAVAAQGGDVPDNSDFVKAKGGVAVAARKPWAFSAAGGFEKACVAALAAVNCGLVWWLTARTLAAPAAFTAALGPALGGAWGPLLAGLNLYAASYVVLPLARRLANAGRNVIIGGGNRRRTAAAEALAAPSMALKRKLRAARQMGRTVYVGRDDVVFDSRAETQAVDVEAEDWDERLKRQGAEKRAGGRREAGGGVRWEVDEFDRASLDRA